MRLCVPRDEGEALRSKGVDTMRPVRSERECGVEGLALVDDDRSIDRHRAPGAAAASSKSQRPRRGLVEVHHRPSTASAASDLAVERRRRVGRVEQACDVDT
jgi:hypothetical protein